MNRRWIAVSGGTWIAVSALACGLVTGTTGCGGAPDPTSTNDKGSGTSDKGGGISETAWAQKEYPATWGAVQSFMAVQDQLSGRSIALVTALYRHDVDGPAYLEFVLRSGSEDAGYIVASTGGHDVPIVAWTETGSSISRTLEKQHQRNLSGARIFAMGISTFAAELPDGSIVSNGAPIKPEAWAAAKTRVVPASDTRTVQHRERVAKEWERAATVGNSALPSDVVPRCPVDGCGGDPCDHTNPNYPKCLCPGTGFWRVRGADIQLPPNYFQFWGNWWNGSCYSGCTPTSMAMIAGWISHQAGDHRDGSVWGHPRMSYAYDNWGWEAWAPQTANTGDADPTEWHPMVDFHDRFETTCLGDGGATRLTPPYDRIKNLSQQYFTYIGAPISTASYYHGSWEGYMAQIQTEIHAGRPVEVNALDNPVGDGAHSWIVWGHNYNCFGEWYGINLTWSDWPPTWVEKGSVLGALTPSSDIAGEGIVMFRPTTTRDHGPITTGAGSTWCLDPTWSTEPSVVWQYGCHGGANQLWYLDHGTDINAGWQVRNKNSGLCLAPEWNGPSNGSAVLQWTCASNNTFWHISKRGTKVVLKHTLSNRCLDLDNAGGMAGNFKKIQVWDCNAGSNQLFDFGY